MIRVLRSNLGRTPVGLATLTALSIGFERVNPAISVTDDLRLTTLRLVLLLTLGFWVVSLVASRRRPHLPRHIALPTGLWLALLFVSAVLAPSYQQRALVFVRDIVLGAAFGWAVYDLATTPARQVGLARGFAMTGMGVALLGLAEAADVPLVRDWLVGFRYVPAFNVGEVPRVASTLTHPNIAAMVLVLVVPLQLAWLASTTKTWARAALGLGLIAELVTLVLTISRAGVLALEIVLGLVLVASLVRRQTFATRVTLASFVALPVVLGVSIVRQPILLLHLTSEVATNWYAADYLPPPQMTVHPGEAATVPVRLANIGERVWSASGAHPFALSYHLSDADGTPVTYDGPRTPLPRDLAPGGTVEVEAQVLAPREPGNYIVEWDEVQEQVTWFSWAGSPVGVTFLKVGDSVNPSDFGQAIQPTAAPRAMPPRPTPRLTQWQTALSMALSRPLVGVGPDNFRWVYGDFAEVPAWDTGGHANSVYFEFLADTGVVGLGLFLWLTLRLLRSSIASVLTPRGIDTGWIWRLAFAASLCAWFIHGFLDYFYEPLPTNLAFWLVAALALAAAERVRASEQDDAPCASPTT